MVVSHVHPILRICAAACVAMALTSLYIMFQTPDFMEVTMTFTIPTPISAKSNERNAHKNLTPDSTKYYSEPGGSYELAHYDTRYFQKELEGDERLTVLIDLIQSYLSVASQYGIQTWLAHGTLLGWRWGGHILPWDSDLDVQVSYETLRYLAAELNFTEFRYDFHRANGRLVSKSYLLDINPHYSELGAGDGGNLIDARWIDTMSGKFVDITAVRQRDESGQWSCKDGHHYAETDLWPLKEAEFEGVKALVPAEPTRLLHREYGEDSTENEEYNGHHWDHSSKLWVQN